MASAREEIEADLGMASEVEDLAGIRKERGIAKGLITRLINNIDNIPKNKEHVEKVKEKISSLPEIVQRFEEAHQLYIASLKDDGAKQEALLFHQTVIDNAESFEQAIYTSWWQMKRMISSPTNPSLFLTWQHWKKSIVKQNKLLLTLKGLEH